MGDTLSKRIEEVKEFGDPIFKEIFSMSDQELLNKLESICGEDLPDHMISNYGKGTWVIRTSVNEEPRDITVEFYDVVKIDAFGIHLKHEHGSYNTLVKFNQHFKL